MPLREARMSLSPAIAYDRLVDALRKHGCKVNANGDSANAQCPHHEDKKPSLSLKAVEGQVLVYCHAGCEAKDIVAALDMGMASLFDNPRGQSYVSPDGRIVDRTPRKRFSQRGNTRGTALFRSDRIGDGTTVYVPEGEKTCCQ